MVSVVKTQVRLPRATRSLGPWRPEPAAARAPPPRSGCESGLVAWRRCAVVLSGFALLGDLRYGNRDAPASTQPPSPGRSPRVRPGHFGPAMAVGQHAAGIRTPLWRGPDDGVQNLPLLRKAILPVHPIALGSHTPALTRPECSVSLPRLNYPQPGPRSPTAGKTCFPSETRKPTAHPGHPARKHP